MEAAGQVDGEAGPGSSDGGQVHDEMPHRGGGTPTKRWKSIVVGGVKTDYVADSESEDEEDCVMLRQNVVYVADSESGSDKDCVMLEQNDVKMPGAQVPAGPSGMEPNAVAMKMDWTEEDAKDDPGKAGNGESGGVFEQSTDEAVSQYLEESGGCLTELMLNNVEKVGYLTAFAISRKCSVRLEALDLSFCRELTNEALGLIVESCPSLRILKLFGCTQITDFFLKGHSNTLVKIIGIEGNILDQMDHR
nr:unnamed protein product [Digitaria exilis]